jgi:histidyl-tRNA synthetase
LSVIQQLRAAGKVVEYSLTPAKGDKQFKRALELKARHTVRVERNAEAIIAKVKNLATRAEQVLPLASVAEALKGGTMQSEW